MAKKKATKEEADTTGSTESSGVVNASQQAEKTSILEQAKQEQNQSINAQKSKQGAGESSRPITKEVFRMWLMLPDQFKGAPERITALLGITDPVMLEVLKISTHVQFAEEFGVAPYTLSYWRKEMEEHEEFGKDVKRQMRGLTKNLLGAMYRKALEEGDAARCMAWMKIIEGWKEELGVEHSGRVSNLTTEEQAALDKLIAKNKGV